MEQALDLRDVIDHVLPLGLELIDERLVLLQVAGLVEAELGHVFDAHLVDGIELGGSERASGIWLLDRPRGEGAVARDECRRLESTGGGDAGEGEELGAVHCSSAICCRERENAKRLFQDLCTVLLASRMYLELPAASACQTSDFGFEASRIVLQMSSVS